MSIRYIRGRIQGRDVTVDMADDERHILLVGDNGAGKDTISRVIALALSGGVDDTLNRGTASPNGEPVRAPVDMAYLIADRPGDAPDGLYCEVGYTAAPGQEPSVATYSLLAPTKGGPRTRTWNLPADVALEGSKTTKNTWWTLPVREVFSMLAAGPDSARKWFLPYIVQGSIRQAVLAAFQASGVSADALASVGVHIPETSEALIDMLETQTAAAAEAAAAHKALQAAVTLRKQSVTSVRPSQEQLIAANAAQLTLQSRARQLREALGAAGGSRPLLELIAEKQATLAMQAVTLTNEEAALRQLQSALPPAPDPAEVYPPFVPSSAWGQVAAAWKALRLGVLGVRQQYVQACAKVPNVAPPTMCPLCGTEAAEHATAAPQGPFRSPEVRAATLLQRDKGAQDVLDRLASEQSTWAAGQAEWESKRTRATEAHRVFNARVAQFNNWVTAHTTLKQEIANLSASAASSTATPVNTPTQAEVEIAEQAAMEAISAAERLQATNAQWVTLDGDDGNVATSAMLLEKKQSMVDTLSRIVEDVLTAAVEDFQTRVQSRLPVSMRVKILLRDPGGDGRRVFRFGLVDGDGILAVALSGGQRLAVMLALTETILDQIPYATGAATLFTPDEVSWHKHTLGLVMAAMAQIKHTIVLCAAEAPDEIPAGWKVVNVAEAATKCPAAGSVMLIRARGGGEEKKKAAPKSRSAKARETPASAAATAGPAEAPHSIYDQPDAATPPPAASAASEPVKDPAVAPEPAPAPAPEPAPQQTAGKPSNMKPPFPTPEQQTVLTGKLEWTQPKIRRMAPDVIELVLRDQLRGTDYVVGVDGKLIKIG